MSRATDDLALILMVMLLPSVSMAQRVAQTKLAAPNAQLEHEFTRIGTVRALADGRVLVSDAGDTKLFVADFARHTVTQVGRAGQGPNEYSAVNTLFPLANDSTLLPDTRGGRWLLLHGAEIVEIVPGDSPAIRSGARNPLGADHGGHVLITARERPTGNLVSTTMAVTDSLWILRVARSTGKIDTIGKAAGRPGRITVRGREQARSVEIVMNPMAVGEQTLLFPDGWIAVARLDPYLVEWIAADGRQIRGSNLPDERVRIDEAVKRWFLEELAQNSGQPPRNPKDLPDDWPATIPPFGAIAILAAPDGSMWIRRFATERAAPSLYDVIDRRGRLVRRVIAPRNHRVVGFGPGEVYSVATDHDGIQRLQRHSASP